MKQFTITELENFSGIKSHTIRIWEKRFHLMAPSRTGANTRLYDITTLKHFLNLALLNRNGLSISKIAEMGLERVQEKIDSLFFDEQNLVRSMNQLIVYMFTESTDEFEAVLDKSIQVRGIDDTINDLIIPFLSKVNLLSYNETSSEVHFCVNILRKKIILGIESVKAVTSRSKTTLLFLPEKEHYDLMLLYMDYFLKKNGFKVFYLGTNISEKNIIKVATEKKVLLLITYLSAKQNFRLFKISKYVKEQLPGASIIVIHSGDITEPPDIAGVVQLYHYSDLQRILA